MIVKVLKFLFASIFAVFWGYVVFKIGSFLGIWHWHVILSLMGASLSTTIIMSTYAYFADRPKKR